jgi:hypothetical protein
MRPSSMHGHVLITQVPMIQLPLQIKQHLFYRVIVVLKSSQNELEAVCSHLL